MSVTTEKKIILSGFGKFGDVIENPTTIIINELCNQTINGLECSIDISIDNILEVSVENVNSFVKNDVNNVEKLNENNDNLIYVHLGVDSSANSFKLEQCAWNNMTFRIPDEKGYQPNEIVINSTKEFDSCLKTSLNVNLLHESLVNQGYNVILSEDPGLFIYTICLFFDLIFKEYFVFC